MKFASDSRFGIHPNPSPVVFQYALAKGQTYPRARVLLTPVEALKDYENLFEILLLYANSIVPN